MKEENITSANEIRKKIAESTGKLVLYIVLFVIVEAIVNNFLFPFLESIKLQLPYITVSNQSISSYQPYVNILLSLAFGYLIIQGFISVVYWNLRLKYDHSTSASMRSVFRLVGIGALVAAIAGAVGRIHWNSCGLCIPTGIGTSGGRIVPPFVETIQNKGSY